MADLRSFKKPQYLPQELQENPSTSSKKSRAHILCKSLVFLLFLIAIPLFPAQAPDFITQSIFTKFWELVHLLFIGLAVCYGLFSRRNVEVDFESHSNQFDDSQSSFVSRIFHVSPIFEDGSESESVSDAKFVYSTWNSQFYKAESMVSVANSAVIDEQSRTENLCNSEIPPEHDVNSVFQAWNSQYFHGESVVVSQPNYGIDEWGQPQKTNDYLGLPVRRLNSRIRNTESVSQLSNGSESGSSLMGSSSSSPMSKEDENGNIGSRSGRPEFRERAQFRPLSVDETQFELLKSQSSQFRPLSVDETQFEYLKSQSSQVSSMSNSPKMSPSHSSSSDSQNSRTEELGKIEEKDGTDAAALKNREARLNAFHLRRYSSGSLFQKDMSKKSENGLKGPRQKRRENSSSLKSDTKYGTGIEDMAKKAENDLKELRRKLRDNSPVREEKTETKPVMIAKDTPKRAEDYLIDLARMRREDSLRSDAKPAASSRGKSVRTIRSGAYTPEPMKTRDTGKNHINEKVVKGFDESKTLEIVKNGMKREGLDDGVNKKNLDLHDEAPKPTLLKHHKKEEGEVSENVMVESERESEGEIEEFRPSFSNDAVTECSWYDPNEVDKKAGEFIAKFREQIRLQKVASMDRSKGLKLSGKYLR